MASAASRNGQRQTPRSIGIPEISRECPLGLPGDSRGRRHIEFGQFTSKKRVSGEFCDQLRKLCAGYFCVFLTQGRQGQQNLRKRPEIVAALGGDLELLDACFLVAANSREAEKKFLVSWQTSDDVIRCTQGEIGIGGIRRDRQQSVGVPISVFDHFQAFHLMLIDQRGIVGLHTQAQGHGEQGVRIIRVRLQSELRQVLRLLVRREECRTQSRIRFESDPAQKTFVVEEKLGGQYALPIALLEQISCRFRGAPKGVFRMRLLPGLKLRASFLGLQLIEQVKAGIEFRYLQYRELRLPATCRGRKNSKGQCDQHAAEKPKYHWAGHGERAILTSFWQPDRRIQANDTGLYSSQGSFPNRTLPGCRQSRRKEFSMNLNLMDPKLIAVAVVVILVIVVGVALYVRKRKNTTAELRNRFGPEYDRAVKQHGSERKAEAKLADRETRVDMLKIPIGKQTRVAVSLQLWLSDRHRCCNVFLSQSSEINICTARLLSYSAQSAMPAGVYSPNREHQLITMRQSGK